MKYFFSYENTWNIFVSDDNLKNASMKILEYFFFVSYEIFKKLPPMKNLPNFFYPMQ